MQKNKIIEKIEEIAINAEESQVRLNALNLLLSHQTFIEKEEEIQRQQEKNNEKLKTHIKNLTEGLF